MQREVDQNKGQALRVPQALHEKVVTHADFWNVITILAQSMPNQGVASSSLHSKATFNNIK